ncbi:MAG: helix-turn-helix domain-containing protein [Dysgonamonadaceae bacterium]|jgi:predicted DNA-binding transcriptional regulator AlpA|nr:helix-turn-helix domain-containing protein [Dysgonamonadaceae bacterium]
MKQIDKVNDIQKLIKRQKAYQKGILVMTEKLFDIQNQIATLTLKELNKDRKKEKPSTDLLSAKDVCSMLEISQSTLYRMRMYDGFPFVKIEGRKSVMFNKKEIEEYMANLKKHKP